MLLVMTPRERTIARLAVISGFVFVSAFCAWFGWGIHSVENTNAGYEGGLFGVLVYSVLAYLLIWRRS